MSGAASRVTKLGETELTAYRGDRGKVAYDHSQAEGNPHGLTTADIPDFDAALLSALSDLLVAGTGITVAWNVTNEQWTITSTVVGTTNLAIANRGTTTLDVTSDTGTDATIPAATTSLAGLLTSADKSKLDGIAAGATANSTDAFLLSRANHTGTQAISTVTGLQTALDGKAELSHTHGNITNAGAIGSTSGLPIITGASGVLQVGSFGTTAGTFAQGNDTRIVNAAQVNASNSFSASQSFPSGIVLPVNSWITDATPSQRIYFGGTSTTFFRAYGSTPYIFRNGDGSDIVRVLSSGAILMGLFGGLQFSDDGSVAYLADGTISSRTLTFSTAGTFSEQVKYTAGASVTPANAVGFATTYTFAASASGRQSQARMTATYNQSGSAGSVDLELNRTDTALGSGTHAFISCNKDAVERFRVTNIGNVTIAGVTFLGTFTFGTLPTASSNAGASAQITDCNTTTNGANAAGGGSSRVMVFSNGTNWKVAVG